MDYAIMGILMAIVLGISCLINFIDWRRLGERIYGNNPNKARIYVEYGEQVMAYVGKLVYSDDDGDLYFYRGEGEQCIVCVPFKYPHKYLNGRRQVKVKSGEVEPIAFENSKTTSEGVGVVSALCRSHLLKEAVLALTTKGTGFNWKVALLIVGAVIIGWYVYTNYMEVEAEVPQPQSSVPEVEVVPSERPTDEVITDE